jgi:hypothetical protein
MPRRATPAPAPTWSVDSSLPPKVSMLAATSLGYWLPGLAPVSVPLHSWPETSLAGSAPSAAPLLPPAPSLLTFVLQMPPPPLLTLAFPLPAPLLSHPPPSSESPGVVPVGSESPEVGPLAPLHSLPPFAHGIPLHFSAGVLSPPPVFAALRLGVAGSLAIRTLAHSPFFVASPSLRPGVCLGGSVPSATPICWAHVLPPPNLRPPPSAAKCWRPPPSAEAPRRSF